MICCILDSEVRYLPYSAIGKVRLHWEKVVDAWRQGGRCRLVANARELIKVKRSEEVSAVETTVAP